MTAILLACAPHPSGFASPAPPERFLAGDRAFRERRSQERARQALGLYRAAFQENRFDPEAAWRLAMACYFVGIRHTPDESDRKSIYEEGYRAAVAATKLKPDCAPCQFWAAITLALYGEAVGVYKSLVSLGEVREHLKSSIDVDPAIAGGGAYRLLGLIEQKLPGILGGSNDRARRHFEKAVGIAPDEPLNYLFLSQLLLDGFGERAAALEWMEKGLAAGPPAAERVESVDAYEELKALHRRHSTGS